MTAIFTFFQIAGSSSWHARFSVLTYLQIMVFYNLFTILSNEQAVQEVRALVIRLLEDEQLEVPFGPHWHPGIIYSLMQPCSLNLHLFASLCLRWERWLPPLSAVSCSVTSWQWMPPCRLTLRLYAKPDYPKRGREALWWTLFLQSVWSRFNHSAVLFVSEPWHSANI